MGNLRNGPFDTEREARAAAHEVVRPEPGWSKLHKSQSRFVVEQACESAGVELGVYDRQILDWLSGFEDSVCAVVAGLVARAVAAARPSPNCVTFDMTNDHNAEMFFVLTQVGQVHRPPPAEQFEDLAECGSFAQLGRAAQDGRERGVGGTQPGVGGEHRGLFLQKG